MKLALVLCCVAAPAIAQTADLSATVNDRAETAPGAVIRVLDKVSGALSDIELANGQSTGYGRLEITLGECRFPADNPSSDAYAYLTIRDTDAAKPDFAGWMFASSPALNALDHPRYDVWVLRCKSN